MRRLPTFASIAGIVVVAAAIAHATDIGKALADAEARRRAAESGVQQVQPKVATDGNEVRAAYDEAATAQNAWLDAVIQSFEKGAAANATDSKKRAAVVATLDQHLHWKKFEQIH